MLFHKTILRRQRELKWKANMKDPNGPAKWGSKTATARTQDGWMDGIPYQHQKIDGNKRVRAAEENHEVEKKNV